MTPSAGLSTPHPKMLPFALAAGCLASRKEKRASEDGLASTGYSNWKRALNSFREHEKTATHRASLMAWKGYKATKVHGDVMEQVVAASAAEITEHREYFCRLVAITTFLAKQGIALRGHSEGEDSQRRGNLLECLQLLQKFDPFLQAYNCPSNATYTSPTSHNDMIHCCSSQISKRLSEEVREAKMFAVMADEAKDGHTEQLAVCVRYVFEESIQERFLGLKKLEGYNAASITRALEEVLDALEIGNIQVVAQSYDVAVRS